MSVITVSPMIFHDVGKRKIAEPMFLRALDGYYIGGITKLSPEFYPDYVDVLNEYTDNNYREQFFKTVTKNK